MLHTSYKYLKNNGLIATFLKVYSYLKNNGVSKLFNRFSQLNNYSKFDNPIINCSPDSLHSLPMKALVIHKENIRSENKKNILSLIDNYDVVFIKLEDDDIIFHKLQFSQIVILYDFNFEFLSESIKIEIDRLSVKTLTYDVLINSYKSETSLFKKKNIVVVNCFYYPSSFGGATIVVEELNKRLYNNSMYELFTFTIGVSNNKDLVGKVIRYEAFNQNVFAYYVDKLKHNSNSNNDSHLLEAFENVLINLKPELVHFHSIQGMGDEMLSVCSNNKIKNIVTCHDFWWLTERQFISTLDFTNDEINKMVPNFLLESKSNIITQRIDNLEKSNLVLTPSLFLENILKELGLNKIKLNKNGIKEPVFSKNYFKSDCVVFGFLGGKSEIKGYNLVIEAFKKLNSNTSKLLIVDNTLSLGFSSFNKDDFEGVPNYEIIPSFTQDQIDDFYCKIDVLLYPSLAIESFGLAPREATSRNILVISTDVGGISEDINELHYVIKPHFTADDLYEKILEVHEHVSSNCNLISKKLKHTTFDFQANELLSIYNSLIPNDDIQKSEI